MTSSKLPAQMPSSVIRICSIFFLLGIFLAPQIIKAQAVTDTLIPKDSIALIEKKLVELALEGPQYNSAEYQNKINEFQLRKAKSSWLNLLSISGTFNEQTFAKDDPAGPATYVFPRYNFGVSVPLGIIFSKGLDIKSARASVELSKNNQTQLTRNIKADILSKYRQYRNLEARILAQTLVVDDEEAIYLQMKKKFENGQTSFELHNAASKSYNNEVEKKMNLEMQKDLLEFEIERIIGVELESIIK